MNEQLLTAALDKALSRITRETGLVGGVVRVIQGGKTVYTYEYGWADRENRLPMTQDTLFDVASTSKAWTVMLAAQCVDDGLLEWDEPVQKHIPEFTMLDSYAGEHLSARDMASHRSGLPGHDFLREKIAGDREKLMRKTAFLEPNVGFRAKYQYNNHMFILLGYLVERLRGQLWEDQIAERIAKPLGVEQIRFRGINRDMEQVAPALPYCSDGYRAERCGYASNYHSAPCGGIRISMKDMARWIAAMSRGGVTESGARLCSEEQFREIIAPVISCPEEDCGWLKSSSYAQGWINADYLGHHVVFHSGGLSGFNTQVGFLPEEDCGYVMCFNTGSTPGSEVARAIVLDALTREEPVEAEYDAMIDRWLERRDAMRAKLRSNEIGTPVTAESHPRLAGVYWHPAYETFEIVEDGNGLRFVYGDFTARLMQERDGRIIGYSGDLDGLTPAGIQLFPQKNGDLRMQNPDSGELKLLFVRE